MFFNPTIYHWKYDGVYGTSGLFHLLLSKQVSHQHINDSPKQTDSSLSVCVLNDNLLFRYLNAQGIDSLFVRKEKLECLSVKMNT